MTYQLAADSSANVLTLEGMPFACVPLTIRAGETYFTDDERCDVPAFTARMQSIKGRSSTACPSAADWLNAFGDAERVFCVTLTSALSGTYNAACLAAREYEAAHPGRRVFVMDSLSAGPQIRLILEELARLIAEKLDFDSIVERITAYQARTHLAFSLCSLHNFVQNGWVSPAVGALVGLLGIRVVGRASVRGELEPLAKTRGDRKALTALVSTLESQGWQGGSVRIDHVDNPDFAESLKAALLAKHPNAQVTIGTCRALCAYYAEAGGVLVGFEGECSGK